MINRRLNLRLEKNIFDKRIRHCHAQFFVIYCNQSNPFEEEAK